MRVLHLTSEYPPVIWGGLGTAVGGLTKASAQAGIDIDVLLIRHAGDEMSYGHKISATTSRDQTQRRVLAGNVTCFTLAHENASANAIRLARQLQPDVIHIHPVELWPVAQALHQALGIPIVYTVHSLNLAEYEVGKEPPEILNLWRLQQALIAGATRVIVLTQDEKELLLAACPAVGDRVRIVGNGIEDHEGARRAAQRAKVGRAPLVLYAGRFVDRKGIHELLAAIPGVLRAAPETRFVLAGGYGCGADIERAWLPPALAPYRDQIHFTGWLKPAQVAEWYAQADILVAPSWYEPFGMVILEGMLYGLPIVATNVGGPAEILRDGQTGLLVPAKDSVALADALQRLVTNAPLRCQLGATAATEVRNKWLWPQIVEKMRAVYDEAMGLACISRG